MKSYIFIFTAILLSSCCDEDVTVHYYHKCFFLGETNFLIEGEVFRRPVQKTDGEPYSKESFPFDSLVARINGGPAHYKEWKIPAEKISESKFRMQVDITANGITIDKDIISTGAFEDRILLLEDEFGKPVYYPAFQLSFYLDGNFRYSYHPEFQYKNENTNKYSLEYYSYVYVAVPIDNSRTSEREEPIFFNQKLTEIHHYDLNFSKPGWYKIIKKYYREIDDNPEFFTGENTWFFDYTADPL